MKYNLKKAKQMMKKGFSWNTWLMGFEAELREKYSKMSEKCLASPRMLLIEEILGE